MGGTINPEYNTTNNSTSMGEIPSEDYNDLGTPSASACAVDTCCRPCVIPDAMEEGQYPETNLDQVIKVLVTVDSDEGITLAQSCATSEVTDVLDDESDDV